MKLRKWGRRVIAVTLVVLLTSVIGSSGLVFTDLLGKEVSAATITIGNYTVDSRIRLNSIGFLPDSDKKATIATSCTGFQLARDNGEVVFEGTATQMYDGDTREQVWIADFSSVNSEGTYCLVVPGVGRSVNFKIAGDVYNEAYKTAMLGMYLMRCGTSVSATYNGITYSHAACHTNDAYTDYINGQHTIKDGKKGWHDAGDYNKYVVNAGVTVGSMFMAWEHFQDRIESMPLTVPESSNPMPDFLDEMKWEIDWLFSMQYPDGSGKVSYKLTTKNFGDFIMPENETDERYFTPWGTASTADFVAMMAMASRIFRPYDAEYADKCIEAAKVSYACLKANPSNVNANQSGFSTGGYFTKDTDDRIWAAAEMWETLGDSIYLSDFESLANSQTKKIDVDFDWGEVKNLGMFTYLLSERPGKNQSLYNSIKSALISTADSIVDTRNSHGYARPLGNSYYWGCNGGVARQTMVLQVANMISPKSDYVNTALDAIGHLFGRNYYGRSYVTGLGVNPPMNPHDRRSGGDNIKEPWPGCLVGGGHSAKGWKDIEEDYETNEIAINWSGAFIYALAGFVYDGTTPTTPPTSTPGQNPDFMYGDLNGSNTVDSTDYALMKRYILGTTELTYQYGHEAADLNGDGEINSTDYALMKRYILGVVNKLPV